MARMATYTADDDTYAGFNSTGKYFGYFGLAAGAVGITGWAAMHGHLPGLKPAGFYSQNLVGEGLSQRSIQFSKNCLLLPLQGQ